MRSDDWLKIRSAGSRVERVYTFAGPAFLIFTWPETNRELRYFVVVILLRFRFFEISSMVSPFCASLKRPIMFWQWFSFRKIPSHQVTRLADAG